MRLCACEDCKAVEEEVLRPRLQVRGNCTVDTQGCRLRGAAGRCEEDEGKMRLCAQGFKWNVREE